MSNKKGQIAENSLRKAVTDRRIWALMFWCFD